MYDPRIVVHAPAPHERLTKRYHRVWHSRHGRFYALMRNPSFQRWQRGAAAFAHEGRLRFLVGFVVQRISNAND